MAHVSTFAHTSSRPLMATAFDVIATFFANLAEARVAAKTFDTLNALSDAELRDIGLERSELSNVAFKGKL